MYTSLEDLQQDLDLWLEHYNKERTHTGKHCFGRTPYQTLLETIPLAEEKMLDNLKQDPVKHFFLRQPFHPHKKGW